MTALLATDGLTMRFGGVVAVDGVTLAVNEGELRCLIGPNGAGKSTFFKCLTGQYRPTLGPHLLARPGHHGLRRHRHRPARRRHQDPGAVAVRWADRAGKRALWRCAAHAWRAGGAGARRAGAGAARHRQPSPAAASALLAHGQRQLVELAMVVAPEPDLIILDEPTAGMSAEETAARRRR